MRSVMLHGSETFALCTEEAARSSRRDKIRNMILTHERFKTIVSHEKVCLWSAESVFKALGHWRKKPSFCKTRSLEKPRIVNGYMTFFRRILSTGI